MIIIFYTSVSLAQENILSSGGNNETSSGTVNYSIGLMYFKDATGIGGNSFSGMQIPYEIIEQLSIDENQIITLKV